MSSAPPKSLRFVCAPALNPFFELPLEITASVSLYRPSYAMVTINQQEKSMAKPATAVVRTFPSNVGVPEHNRKALIALLNARLADSFDLRSQVKWAHWNLKGMHFIQLHELFDSIASHLEEQTDSIAERVTTLVAWPTELPVRLQPGRASRKLI
jgi:hypothetical protein